MEERNISEDKEFMERLDKAVDMQMSGKGNDNNSFDLIDYVFNAIKDYYIGTEADSSQEQQTSPCFGDKDFGDDFFEMIKQDICLELLYRRMTKPLKDACAKTKGGKPYKQITTLQDEYDPMLLEYHMPPFYVHIYGELTDEKIVPNMYRIQHKYYTVKDLVSLQKYLHNTSNDYIDKKDSSDLLKLVNKCYLERAYCFFIKSTLYSYYTNMLKYVVDNKSAPFNISVENDKKGGLVYKLKRSSIHSFDSLDNAIKTSISQAIDALIYVFDHNQISPLRPDLSYEETIKMIPYLPNEYYKPFEKAFEELKETENENKAKTNRKDTPNHLKLLLYTPYKKRSMPPKPGYCLFIVKLVEYIARYIVNDSIFQSENNDANIIFYNINARIHRTYPYLDFIDKVHEIKLSSHNAREQIAEEKRFLYCFANSEFAKTSKSRQNNLNDFTEYINKFIETIDYCNKVSIDPSKPISDKQYKDYIRIFTKALSLSLTYFVNEIRIPKIQLHHYLSQTIQDLNHYINSYYTYSESMEFAQICASYEFVITRSYFFKIFVNDRYPVRYKRNEDYIKKAKIMMATVNKIYSSTLEVIAKYAKKHKISLDEKYLKDCSYNHISIIDNPEYVTSDIEYIPTHIQNLIIYEITTKPRPYSVPFFSKDYKQPIEILGTPLGTIIPETL